jgi:hypothetical protein
MKELEPKQEGLTRRLLRTPVFKIIGVDTSGGRDAGPNHSGAERLLSVGFDDNRALNLEGARSALPVWRILC